MVKKKGGTFGSAGGRIPEEEFLSPLNPLVASTNPITGDLCHNLSFIAGYILRANCLKWAMFNYP